MGAAKSTLNVETVYGTRYTCGLEGVSRMCLFIYAPEAHIM
jgi:hypothetical protein